MSLVRGCRLRGGVIGMRGPPGRGVDRAFRLFGVQLPGTASSLRCFGGQPWAHFAFCEAVPYHGLKQKVL